MSELERVSDLFKASLLLRFAETSQILLNRYQGVAKRIKSEAILLAAQIQEAKVRGEQVSPAWLYQQRRFNELLGQVEREVRKFEGFLSRRLLVDQKNAIELAAIHTRELLRLQLPGQDLAVLGQINKGFMLLNTKAVEAQAGVLAGGPVHALIKSIAPATAKMVEDRMVQAVALGKNPKVLAREIVKSSGVGLQRGLVIARNEMLRSYREGLHQSFLENEDIIDHWRWNASIGTRTCPICLALHGQIFPTATKQFSHVNCRCTMVPVTKSWEELGFTGIEDTPETFKSGPEWFAQFSDKDQLKVLGRGKYELYKAGKLQLSDLVGYKVDPVWGPQRFERSLKILTQ